MWGERYKSSLGANPKHVLAVLDQPTSVVPGSLTTLGFKTLRLSRQRANPSTVPSAWLGALLEGFRLGLWGQGGGRSMENKPWECWERALGFGGRSGRKGALLDAEGGSQWIC